MNLGPLCIDVSSNSGFLSSMNDSRGFDAEKAGSNGLPTSKNGLNGNGVGPLPPDGMYHVSDIGGGFSGGGGGGGINTNIDMIHGSLTDKVNNKSKFIMPSSTCV